MTNFYDTLVIGGVFTSFLTSILLFTKGRYQLHANRLLGVVIFAWAWYGLLYFLVTTGWIKAIPEIYRIGSPLYYLIPPCSYLYMRSIILNQTHFKKYDWLHFLPALINFIDLLPFYFLDSEAKREVVNAIINNFSLSYQKGSGFIPAFWHFQLRWMLGIAYLIVQWRLLLQVKQKEVLHQFKTVIRWLVTFVSFNTVIYVGLGIMSVIAWVNLGEPVNILLSGRSIPTLLQIIGFMCMSVYLFFKPEVLYGLSTESSLPLLKSEEITEANKPRFIVSEKTFAPELIESYLNQIEDYIQTEKPFKRHGFTVSELANELNMPLHHLSYVLNSHLKQRFTDFINGYRVSYVIDRIDSNQWRFFTLEALAKEAGFSSRSTFFSAFKKVTGVSPSAYIQSKK